MKSFILTLVLTFSVFTPRAHALFGHVAVEKEKREHVEQQLAQAEQQRANAEQQRAHAEQQCINARQQVVREQRTTGRWRVIAFGLGAGCTGSLVIGAAIRSHGRKHAK